jgi:succinylglutamate desuccinylase
MPSPSTPNDLPLELSPPDISAYRNGNTDIPYAFNFDSGKPGPQVMISAVVHGNELCGAIALDWLLKKNVRPKQGKLALCFMNVDAFQSYNPEDPNASRYVDEDFNRLWTDEVLGGDRQSVELTRARQVRPLVDQVDLLLDIHSMQQPCIPLMMAGPLDKGRALAKQVGIPHTIITDAGHAAGRRMRDYRGFAETDSQKNALLAECGQHWEAGAGTVALDCALRFLRVTDTVSKDFGGDIARENLPNHDAFKVTDVVTIKHDAFTFAQSFTGGEIIPKAGTLLGHDGPDAVNTPHDDCMLVMPSRRLTQGLTAVRLAKRV